MTLMDSYDAWLRVAEPTDLELLQAVHLELSICPHDSYFFVILPDWETFRLYCQFCKYNRDVVDFPGLLSEFPYDYWFNWVLTPFPTLVKDMCDLYQIWK